MEEIERVLLYPVYSERMEENIEEVYLTTAKLGQ
jgi:hypothetical protein